MATKAGTGPGGSTLVGAAAFLGGAGRISVHAVSSFDSPFTASASSAGADLLEIDSSGGPVSVVLPAITADIRGHVFLLKDADDARVNSIDVSAQGTTLDSDQQGVIDDLHGSVLIVAGTTKYWVF